jgi:hypothetical protein
VQHTLVVGDGSGAQPVTNGAVAECDGGQPLGATAVTDHSNSC